MLIINARLVHHLEMDLLLFNYLPEQLPASPTTACVAAVVAIIVHAIIILYYEQPLNVVNL